MAITTSQMTITTMEGWYSGATPPLNPLIGDLWLDTTINEIKKWDGTNWVKQADTQGPQGPKGDSIKSREAYWIKSSTKPEESDKPDPETGDMKGWIKGSEPPESALAGILPSDKFWRIYKETYSNGESEYSKYSEVELIGSYEVLNGLVQFRNGVTTTENIGGQDVTVIDGGKIKSGSIDAKKIYVEDLETLNATIGGFHIGKNSIYSGDKKTIDSIERGIYFDSNGQSYFGDDKNFIRFYQSNNDNYKLQISADSLTFGSGVSVEKAFEDIKGNIQNAQDSAYKAQSSANTAQSTADKAQNTANKAQNSANEAAKTADNYISADSTGIMVSENKDATKETPSNATKNNVLITEKDVKIRNGQKVVASYGDTTIIGTEDGNHIVISDDSIQAKNGDAESLKISLTPDRPIAAYAVDFDGSTVAQRVQNSETITIICHLGEDAISVDRAFLMHEAIAGTDLIIDNSKNWVQYVFNTNSVTITIDGSDTEAKAVQWEKFFQLVIRYIPVRQYTSSIECDSLTAIGNLKVGNRIDANVAELNSVYIGSDVFIGKYLGSERSVIEYIDESGKRANLIQVIKGDGFLELDTGKVEFHPRWWRCGNIVQMEVGVKCTGEVASGANIAEGFVTGVPKPITKSGVRSVSYYGNNASISYMSSDGTFYARNAGADSLKKDNNCIGGFTYITDGTMV